MKQDHIAFAIGWSLLLLAGCASAPEPEGLSLALEECIGAFPSAPVAVNAKCEIVGDSGEDNGDGPHAAKWSNGKLVDIQKQLRVERPAGSRPTAINKSGDVVGFYWVWPPKPQPPGPISSISHAFLYRNGRISDLTSENFQSNALGINDKGSIVGEIAYEGGKQAVLWQADRVVKLGKLPDATWSSAKLINNLGEIAGTSGGMYAKADGQGVHWEVSRGFRWKDGVMVDIGDLGGSSVWPAAINDDGQIVGRALDQMGNAQAFLWKDGLMTALPNLPEFDPNSDKFHPIINKKTHMPLRGGQNCEAISINNQGDIVGKCAQAGDVKGFHAHAVLWKNGKIVDLSDELKNKYGYDRAWFINITDDSKIIGRGEVDPFHYRNFVLTPP